MTYFNLCREAMTIPPQNATLTSVLPRQGDAEMESSTLSDAFCSFLVQFQHIKLVEVCLHNEDLQKHLVTYVLLQKKMFYALNHQVSISQKSMVQMHHCATSTHITNLVVYLDLMLKARSHHYFPAQLTYFLALDVDVSHKEASCKTLRIR